MTIQQNFCWKNLHENRVKFPEERNAFVLDIQRDRRDVTCKPAIDLVTVFDAILTSRQTREKLQCLYENLMSNNFRRTAVLKKISIAN